MCGAALGNAVLGVVRATRAHDFDVASMLETRRYSLAVESNIADDHHSDEIALERDFDLSFTRHRPTRLFEVAAPYQSRRRGPRQYPVARRPQSCAILRQAIFTRSQPLFTTTSADVLSSRVQDRPHLVRPPSHPQRRDVLRRDPPVGARRRARSPRARAARSASLSTCADSRSRRPRIRAASCTPRSARDSSACVAQSSSSRTPKSPRSSSESRGQTGIHVYERYIDAVDDPNWEQRGLDWVVDGIDPDIGLR